MKNDYRQRLHNRCWKKMSEYVRRSEQGKCFTCGVVKPWKEQHAGHRYHDRLDFDPMNIHCQCEKCNKHLHGNLGEYEYNLIKLYGLPIVELLKVKANNSPKYTVLELEKIEVDLKEKLKSLEENDG